VVSPLLCISSLKVWWPRGQVEKEHNKGGSGCCGGRRDEEGARAVVSECLVGIYKAREAAVGCMAWDWDDAEAVVME
jgi:hypothetical protein